MAFTINTRKYYKKLLKYNENLEITFDMYSQVVNDHNFFFCDVFSSKHYDLMYTLFKEKLNTIRNKNDKIKYLNTQLSIYENLKSSQIIDLVPAFFSVLSVGFLGVGLVTPIEEKWLTMLASFVFVGSIMWYFFMKLCIVNKSAEWNFFMSVLEQLKADVIEEDNNRNHMNFRKLIGNIYIKV